MAFDEDTGGNASESNDKRRWRQPRKTNTSSSIDWCILVYRVERSGTLLLLRETVLLFIGQWRECATISQFARISLRLFFHFASCVQLQQYSRCCGAGS